MLYLLTNFPIEDDSWGGAEDKMAVISLMLTALAVLGTAVGHTDIHSSRDCHFKDSNDTIYKYTERLLRIPGGNSRVETRHLSNYEGKVRKCQIE